MTAAIAGATPKWLTSRVAISAATDVLLIPKALTFPADPQVSSIAALASAIAEQARATGEGDADDQKAANILAEGAMEGALLPPLRCRRGEHRRDGSCHQPPVSTPRALIISSSALMTAGHVGEETSASEKWSPSASSSCASWPAACA